MPNPPPPSVAPSTVRGTVLVLASAISFGTISVLTVLAIREEMTILSIVFWRFLFAALALLVVAFTPVRTHLRGGLRLFVVGGLLQAVASYMSLSALRFIPASAVAFLFFTYPAWLALTSAARGVEPLTLKRAGILLLAMVGVALMIGIPGVAGNATLNPLGVALALGSALLYSTYLPVVNHLQRSIPPATGAFYIIAGAVIVYFIAAIVLSQTPNANAGALSSLLAPPATTAAWLYILALALLSTVLAFLLLLRGLKLLGSARTSIIATSEPFFTTVLVVLVLGERLRWTTFAGGACIAAAVVAIAMEREGSG